MLDLGVGERKMQNSTQDCGFRAHTVDATQQKHLCTRFFSYSKLFVPAKALTPTLTRLFMSSPQPAA